MSERVQNGAFDSELEGWESQGNLIFDNRTGGAVIFSGGNQTVNGILRQDVNVTPGETAAFTLKYGKIGVGDGIARVRILITYVNETGQRITLIDRTFSDATGPTFDNRSQAALDHIVSFQFDIPEDVSLVTLRVFDRTTQTTSSDLVVDDVSLDVVCFSGGTLIQTDTGPKLVEELASGDVVMTKDNGPQPIRWIGSNTVKAAGKHAPIRISAGALGQGLPQRDLVVSRQHRILVKSAIVEQMFNTSEVLVPAIKLVELPGISIDETMDEISYYHILFQRHEIIYAEGAPAESLFTGPIAMQTIPQEARDEVMNLFPEALKTGKMMEHARLVPAGKQQKTLVREHLKTGLELTA